MDLIKSFIDLKVKLRERVSELVSTPVTENKLPVYPQWFYSARLGQPRQLNASEIREFGKNTWPQMVKSSIKKAIQRTDWKIVLKDENDEGDSIDNYQADVDKITNFLEQMNVNKDDISDMMGAAFEDLADLDAGVWVKAYSQDSYEEGTVEILDGTGQVIEQRKELVLKPFGQRNLLQIFEADGASFLKNPDIYRRNRGYYQYSFKHPQGAPRWFDNDEVCYFMINKRTDSVYGFSPIQSAAQVIELMIESTRYNKDFFKNNAIPDAMLMVQNASKESLTKIKNEWEQNMKGKAHKFGFMKADAAELIKLSNNMRDMEWIEGQKWYFHLIFGVFGLSPAEAGFHENVNRSTQEGQERISIKNALQPYLDLFAKKINREIIPELLQDPNPNIKLKFFPKDPYEEKMRFEQREREVKANMLTINEYRLEQGREPVEWGDSPVVNNPFSSPPNVQPEEDTAEEPPQPKPEEKSMVIKADVLEPGEEMVAESSSYETFYLDQLKIWENRVIRGLDKLDLNKSLEYNKKTMGEFLQNLMNTVNSQGFIRNLRRIIRRSMNEGIQSVEQELDLDVGFTSQHDDKLKKFEGQELNGYLINGKKWHGIKGATKELQSEILSKVEEGVSSGKTKKEITEDIKDIFGKAENTQAVRIARTESTRFVNESKMLSYKDVGVQRKQWDAALDDRTSDICNRLHGKIVNIDEDFIDPETNKAYPYPPSHVNCRSVLKAVFSDEE
jgi:HK97 family phage portal protein